MNGFGLSRERFALLFSVMLVAAAGNTAMQSLLPAIGRELGVADIWVAVAFSLSAVIWVVMAPFWARRADRRGRRALMRLGLAGFIASMLICGGALAPGLAGSPGGDLRLHHLHARADFYGAFGSASPPAVQAYIAARTDGERRGPARWPCSPPPSGSARSSARRSRRSSSSRRSACRRRSSSSPAIGALVLAAIVAAAARRHAEDRGAAADRRLSRRSAAPARPRRRPRTRRAAGPAALARSARPALAS